MAQPTNLQPTLDLAVQHHQAGRFAAAVDLYRRVLAQQPNHPEIWNALGNALQMLTRFDEALFAFQKAAEQRPNFAEVYFNIGNLMLQGHRIKEAIGAFERAIALRPNFPEAFNNLGHALKQSGQLQPAIAATRQAVTLGPNFHPAWCNLARGLYEAGQFDDALQAARKAVATNFNSPEAHHLLGNALRAVGTLEDAIAAYRRAIELNPGFAEAHNNLGTALLEAGRFDEAKIAYEQAIVANPNYALAHYNLGMILLLRGNFERGWRESEWRWQSDEFATQRSPHPQPAWDGSDPAGKTIFIFPEQGLGDAIQFARYAPLLVARGAKVVLGCQSPLRALLQTTPGVATVSAHPSETPPFDLQIAAASLPYRFGTTLATIPVSVPYLHADPEKAEYWKHRISNFNGLKVGLVWAGRPQHPRDRARSIKLAMLAPLAQVEHAQFFSLQKDRAADEARDPRNGLNLVDESTDLHDFSDTAALINALDLVISVDTSVAHLAGAMGKTVWVLIPFVPDWRWMLDREDSPWYPTMRLFRQTKSGDWETPINRMVQALREYTLR